MENNYSIPNALPEQRLMLAITKIVRRLAAGINNILVSLEDKAKWETIDSQLKELNCEPVKSLIIEQHPKQNKLAVPDQAVSLNDAAEWQYPVLNYKRQRSQVNLDYLLAISG